MLGALSLLLNGGGLSQLSTITTELNKALNGRESDVRDLITRLSSFARSLDENKDTITTALANINTLAATLRKQKSTIVTTLETLPPALTVLSDEKDKLVALVASLARLGATATQVITASKDDFVSTLQNLQPVLESLAKVGTTIPSALQVMLTYPFPVGTVQKILYGDYANLDLTLNADIATNLCGLLPIPSICPPGASTPVATTKTKTAGTSPVAGSTPQGSTATQLPAMPGSGR